MYKCVDRFENVCLPKGLGIRLKMVNFIQIERYIEDRIVRFEDKCKRE